MGGSLKNTELYQVLNRELDHFPAGSRFFSVREIISRFGYHRRVVDSVLEQMNEEGLIRREPCIGIFSCVTRNPRSRKILFVTPNFPCEEHTLWFQAVRNFVDSRNEYYLDKVYFDVEKPFLPQVLKQNADAMIILRPALNLELEELRDLSALRYPFVFLNTILEDAVINTVNADPVQGAMLAADYLLKHGHRRLMVVVGEPVYIGDVQLRIRTFCDYVSLHGAQVSLINTETHSGESGRQRSYESLCAYLSQHGGADFTGLFCVSDGTMPGIIKALCEHGVAIPEEVSLVGFGNLDSCDFMQPPLTSVGCDRSEAVRMMFVELENIWNGSKKCFKIEAPMYLQERSSVAAAKKASSRGLFSGSGRKKREDSPHSIVLNGESIRKYVRIPTKTNSIVS